MSAPVLNEPNCQFHPFKPVANIGICDLMRLKSRWNAAVTWCEESKFESDELLEWLKRERDIACAFADFISSASSVEQIEAAVAAAPSSRWGTSEGRWSELAHWSPKE